MTPGTEPALSADEWLSGVNRGEVLTTANMSRCATLLSFCLVTESNIKL